MKEHARYYLGTSVYLVITLSYLAYTVAFGDGLAEDLISASVGLLVPVGIWIFFATYGAGLVVVLFYFILLDTWMHSRQYSKNVKLLLIFCSLAILTFASDLIVFNEYVSLLRLLKLFGVSDISLPEENL